MSISLREALDNMDGDSITLNLNDIARDMSDFMDRHELSEKDIADMDKYIEEDQDFNPDDPIINEPEPRESF